MSSEKESGAPEASEQLGRRTKKRVRNLKRKEAQRATGEVRAVARYVRMAPRKLRLVARAIKGRPVLEARTLLEFSVKRAARTMGKILKSASANAEANRGFDPGSLVVAAAWVDEGPTGKGFIPRSRGRASGVHKRTSHVTIVVKEREGAR